LCCFDVEKRCKRNIKVLFATAEITYDEERSSIALAEKLVAFYICYTRNEILAFLTSELVKITDL
jgi:hypothetical protein